MPRKAKLKKELEAEIKQLYADLRIIVMDDVDLVKRERLRLRYKHKFQLEDIIYDTHPKNYFDLATVFGT